MDKKEDNILFFRPRPDVAEENLKKFCKTAENQAQNLDIIFSNCLKNKEFSILYQYLNSEIEFRGGINFFCEKAKINPKSIRQFLHSENEPNIIYLHKILNTLGYQLNITLI